MQPGYPKGIAEEFLGAPEGDIDAALLWGRDENLYLFKGEFYWNFNLKAKSLIVGPRRISKGWPGVPANLSAAVRWTNGKSYFFQVGMQYLLARFRRSADLSSDWHVLNFRERNTGDMTTTPFPFSPTRGCSIRALLESGGSGAATISRDREIPGRYLYGATELLLL